MQKQGTIERVVPNRVCILGIFRPKQGKVSNLQRFTYTQILIDYPSPPPGTTWIKTFATCNI